MERLTDLPNIGPKLAEDLEKTGVTDPDRFRELGAEEAFMRIRAQADPAASLHKREARAGAAAGVKKSLLPPERKAELKRWFKGL